MSESNDSSVWKFGVGDHIQKGREFIVSVGDVKLEPQEYDIKRRLRDESDGARFYHVEKPDGGTFLYSAAAVEGMYHAVDAETAQS